MENWKIYGEGIVPKGIYSGNLFYKEGVKPVIEIKSWNNGKIMFYVKFEFNQVYSVRVFEEGAALNEIFEDIVKFPPDRRINVIYEVEDGDYAREVRKIVGKKLTGARIYQYVILTENYFFEVVSDSEPMITLIEEKAEKEIRIKYQDDYRQGEVDVIFKHLEEPVYMSKSGSFYEADVELTDGVYYYKYLGEDGLELIDKKNKDIFIDESGCWSVLTVDEDGVVEKEIESSATLIEYGISLAGYVLKIKKPSRVPTIIIAVRYTGDPIFNESTTKNIAITTVTEVASPSSPSVKLAPFTVPSTAINTKGTNSTPRIQATSPPEKGIIICVSSG